MEGREESDAEGVAAAVEGPVRKNPGGCQPSAPWAYDPTAYDRVEAK